MPMSENIISGNGETFNQNDFVTDTKEGRKSYQDLSEHSQESFYNSSGIDQGCSSPIIHYKSSGTCKFLLRFLKQKIVCIKEKMNYQSVITLNTKLRTELTWRIENLRYCNDRTFSRLNPQIIIQTDASLTGLGAVCNEVQTSGHWSYKERALHINVLELAAIKLDLFISPKGKGWKPYTSR